MEEAEGIRHAPGSYFESRSFHEDELAGHHDHAIVALVGIPLFVIRDEGPFKTTGDRAEAAARTLREALHSGDRFFVAGQENALPAIYSVSHHGGFPRLVLQVTPRDAAAYSRRSGRDIEPRLLAQWWLGVLRDVFAVVFLNGEPVATLSAPGGDSLALLRDGLHRSVGSETVSPERIRAAVDALPPGTQGRLHALAFTVPAGFSPPPEP